MPIMKSNLNIFERGLVTKSSIISCIPFIPNNYKNIFLWWKVNKYAKHLLICFVIKLTFRLPFWTARWRLGIRSIDQTIWHSYWSKTLLHCFRLIKVTNYYAIYYYQTCTQSLVLGVHIFNRIRIITNQCILMSVV